MRTAKLNKHMASHLPSIPRTDGKVSVDGQYEAFLATLHVRLKEELETKGLLYKEELRELYKECATGYGPTGLSYEETLARVGEEKAGGGFTFGSFTLEEVSVLQNKGFPKPAFRMSTVSTEESARTRFGPAANLVGDNIIGLPSLTDRIMKVASIKIRIDSMNRKKSAMDSEVDALEALRITAAIDQINMKDAIQEMFPGESNENGVLNKRASRALKEAGFKPAFPGSVLYVRKSPPVAQAPKDAEPDAPPEPASEEVLTSPPEEPENVCDLMNGLEDKGRLLLTPVESQMEEPGAGDLPATAHPRPWEFPTTPDLTAKPGTLDHITSDWRERVDTYTDAVVKDFTTLIEMANKAIGTDFSKLDGPTRGIVSMRLTKFHGLKKEKIDDVLVFYRNKPPSHDELLGHLLTHDKTSMFEDITDAPTWMKDRDRADLASYEHAVLRLCESSPAPRMELFPSRPDCPWQDYGWKTRSAGAMVSAGIAVVQGTRFATRYLGVPGETEKALDREFLISIMWPGHELVNDPNIDEPDEPDEPDVEGHVAPDEEPEEKEEPDISAYIAEIYKVLNYHAAEIESLKSRNKELEDRLKDLDKKAWGR